MILSRRGKGDTLKECRWDEWAKEQLGADTTSPTTTTTTSVFRNGFLQSQILTKKWRDLRDMNQDDQVESRTLSVLGMRSPYKRRHSISNRTHSIQSSVSPAGPGPGHFNDTG